MPLTSAMLQQNKEENSAPSALSKSLPGCGREDDAHGNDISFTLIDGGGPNGTATHGELGRMVVTHEELRHAYKHTVTGTRRIGNGGAKLEFRVILSGEPCFQFDASPRASLLTQAYI